MKAKGHKLIGMVALGLALFSNSLSAWAGAATRNEVYISPGGASAQGSLTGARYSADSEQYLSCSVQSNLHKPSDTVMCSATGKSGRGFLCTSTDPRFADAVKGMTDSSHLYIRGVHYGRCSDLEVTNDSIYLR